jgi:hypothetical protein
VNENYVTKVDVGLPRFQRFLTDPIQADHYLQLGAVTLLQCGETQLAGVAGEHDAARDTDDEPGLGVRLEVRVGLANLGKRVRASDLDRVRFASFGQQTFPLALADPVLLGDVSVRCRGRGRSGIRRCGRGRSGVRRIRCRHDVPA